MTRPDLTALLERVEGATAADRELDYRLCWALGIEPWAGTDESRVGLCMRGSKMDKATPALTASIDAAVALVERVLPGWGWTTSVYWCEGDERPPYFADLADIAAIKTDRPNPISQEAWAGTPALALLAALLRSLLAQEADDA